MTLGRIISPPCTDAKASTRKGGKTPLQLLHRCKAIEAKQVVGEQTGELTHGVWAAVEHNMFTYQTRSLHSFPNF